MDGASKGRVARALLWEAVAAQPARFDRRAIFDWFRRHAGWVDALLVEGLVTGATVNDPGRQHIPSPEDVLFLGEDGRFERYDPFRHGRWSKLGSPRKERQPEWEPVAPAPTAVTFLSSRERFTREASSAMAGMMGDDLRPGEVWLRGGIRQGFDLVSADGRTVGAAAWIDDPELGWAHLSETLWLLQHVPRAPQRFVVVGGDRVVARRWVADRAPLMDGIDVFGFDAGRIVDLKAEVRSHLDRSAV